jgi:uncharacterized membrane protein
MGHLQRSTVVSCPPERVFDVLADVERLPEFSEMTVDIKGPGRPVEAGDRFQQVVKILGKELASEWEVVTVERPTLLWFSGTAPGGAQATLIERLTPEGSHTRVELEVDYDLPLGILGDAVDAMYLHGKNEEQADQILDRLRTLCEARP